MVLLIDTNILLDVLVDRPGFSQESATIWNICESGIAKGFVSTLSFANLVYVMRKELSAESIEPILNALKLVFEFVALTPADLAKAARMQWDDFEDALQSTTAGRVSADYIITRNTKDFTHSRVHAISPGELLCRMGI